MLTQIVVSLNAVANAVGSVLLSPVAVVPAWLSATVIAAVTGVLMLIAFKYTSKQDSVKRARDRIKAHLLALSLFKDNIFVSLRSQRGVLGGAGRLFLLSLVPIAVMTIPMCLALAQVASWYVARPLEIDEETVVTVQLGDDEQTLQQIGLSDSAAFETTVGPVRVPAKDMVCWNLKAKQAGYHVLQFNVGDAVFEKSVAVGDGLMRLSAVRPKWDWIPALLYPREQPFPVDSPVQSIDLVYPDRESWVAGTNSWLIFWFLGSLVVAFAVRPLLKVNM
jgi:hypothetical protein